jgi:hypothetical protein
MMPHLKSSNRSIRSCETDALSYILNTFTIVKRRDEAKWGDYRTQRVILEIYDFHLLEWREHNATAQ